MKLSVTWCVVSEHIVKNMPESSVILYVKHDGGIINMKNKIITATIAAITCLTLTACSTGTAGKMENAGALSYIKNLEDGKYYVRHDKTNKCEEVYWGNATFDQNDISSSPDDARVVWFDENMFKKIPTLYKGDSLIYMTSDEIDEKFTFERFEDFGYSVGLCGLTETESGRYSISTDSDDNNTYPGGDTDDLLELNNDSVIIDTLGGHELRAPAETKSGVKVGSPVTRCNSIIGLTKDMTYKAQVYEGTNLHTYEFKADKRIMGSMEVRETNKYHFESEKLIKIDIPDDFNSGYYLINGAGLLRYVNGNSYDENTDFNVPNPDSENDTSNESANTDTQASSSIANKNNEGNLESDGKEGEEDRTESEFNIDQTGNVRVYASLSNVSDSSQVYGYVIDPDGEVYTMSSAGDCLQITFNALKKGNYTIQIYNLGGGSAEISVNYVD